MRKLFYISAFFLLVTVNVFSSPYEMIPPGDPVLNDILYLSVESGKSILSFTPPLSPGEVMIFLESIDESQLSQSAQEAYERIQRRLDWQPPINLSDGNFSFMLNLGSTVEHRTQFNDNISWYPEYTKIPPLISLPFRFNFGSNLQLYFEPIFAMDPEYYSKTGIFSHNVPYEIENYDQNLPLRAYLAFGGSWWNFQIGRDRLSFGTGHAGNLTFSDNAAFYEFARFSLFSSFLKYSLLVSQMPMDIRSNDAGPDIWDGSHESSKTNLERTNDRYFYFHRIEFKVFDILSIALSEGVMAGNAPIEIRYLNPAIIFHSLYSFWSYPDWDGNKDGDMNGSLCSIEVNWNIVESLAVYGQMVMNQYSTPYEAENFENQPPNGLGYLLGGRFSHSFGNWGAVFFAEFIYTDPYLYMNPSPYSSIIFMRSLGISRRRFQYSFIGYPRDRVTVSAGALFFNGDIALSGEFTWLSQGEHGIKWDWTRGPENPEAFYETTPTGTAENSFILSLGAKYKLNSYISFNIDVLGIVTFNNRHNLNEKAFGGQAAASVIFQY
ncbi:MAG: capsule assembly Wzi family protein [Treponema sp.]|nr:capsule assembly Wzi family protein [Treponema sp.]